MEMRVLSVHLHPQDRKAYVSAHKFNALKARLDNMTVMAKVVARFETMLEDGVFGSYRLDNGVKIPVMLMDYFPKHPGTHKGVSVDIVLGKRRLDESRNVNLRPRESAVINEVWFAHGLNGPPQHGRLIIAGEQLMAAERTWRWVPRTQVGRLKRHNPAYHQHKQGVLL